MRARLAGLPSSERLRVYALLLAAFGLLTVSFVGEWGALVVTGEVTLVECATHGGCSSGGGNSTGSTGSTGSPASVCSSALGGLFAAPLGILIVYWNLLPLLFGTLGTAVLLWARAALRKAEETGLSAAVPPEFAPTLHASRRRAADPVTWSFVAVVVPPFFIMLSGLFICVL